jgi:DNA-binding response OmpR family regulator
MMIMLVDDDDLVRTGLAIALDEAGHVVVATSDPHEALELLQASGPPDVLITDINLQSDLDGFDVAHGARRMWPDVRVLLISGLPVDHTGQSLDPRDLYMQKPFSSGHLLGAIEQLTR